ncbi:hypothetical protein HLH28_11020 [Gluconacetobacter tumulisoli]|uniref:Globin domain-containing protein n=1 Tax=Gluconacetobacter tumulisoli TaxID=1286189 RepID=A0A7W4K831_9PROT|nr:hypothetical protein [Gluconacetobacter tumulisoli]
MTGSMDPHTIAVIKATVPALEAHGLEITQEMYARLFRTPSIKALFDMSRQGRDGAQPRALALAVLAYARNIDNPGVLDKAVDHIAHRHVDAHILPEHYPYVVEALLGAISHVLGDAATPEVLEAWGKAYWVLADILIGREKAICAA